MVTGTVISFIGTFIILSVVYLLSKSYQKNRVNKAVKSSETYSHEVMMRGLPSVTTTPASGRGSVSAKSSRRRRTQADLDFEEYDDDLLELEEVMTIASVLAGSDFDYEDEKEDEEYVFVAPEPIVEAETEKPVVSTLEASSFEETVRPELSYTPAAPAYEPPAYDPPSYGGGSSYDSGGSSYDSGGSSSGGGSFD